MDETQDPKPHVQNVALNNAAHEVAPDPAGKHEKKELSIWFFCGILMLAYGLVLLVQGYLDFANPPHTVLANLHPTIKWGAFLTLFGSFYTIKFRPGVG